MTQAQWKQLLSCASAAPAGQAPVALIVDSPWIPGYMGVNTLDYMTDLPTWWRCQRQIREDFPEVLFLPDYWVEFGMAAEPSAYGCKVNFYTDRPPTIGHMISDCDDIGVLAGLPVPNPLRDGLMPLALNYYRRASEWVREAGENICMVAARGPLNVATHMMGVSEFLLALKLYPDETHRLLDKLAALVRQWLQAQADAVGGVQGVLLLDDIIGFLSPEDFEVFAQPYFAKILAAFDVPVKMLHNDTDNPASYPYLADMGINLFNFTHEKPIDEVRRLVGDKVCLVGNVPPLQVLAQGSAQQAEAAARQVLAAHGTATGLLLSAGGGVSPGTPGGNIRALVRAAGAV